MAAVNMVFSYEKEKVKKLDEIAEKEDRSRSGLIQVILLNFLKDRGININYEDIYEN